MPFYQLQVCSMMIQYLYTLQNGHHRKSNYHQSPRILVILCHFLTLHAFSSFSVSFSHPLSSTLEFDLGLGKPSACLSLWDQLHFSERPVGSSARLDALLHLTNRRRQIYDVLQGKECRLFPETIQPSVLF